MKSSCSISRPIDAVTDTHNHILEKELHPLLLSMNTTIIQLLSLPCEGTKDWKRPAQAFRLLQAGTCY